ncbi:hypothetical protein LXL04_003044 [Taraxacum kok-saghyz]
MITGWCRTKAATEGRTKAGRRQLIDTQAGRRQDDYRLSLIDPVNLLARSESEEWIDKQGQRQFLPASPEVASSKCASPRFLSASPEVAILATSESKEWRELFASHQ